MGHQRSQPSGAANTSRTDSASSHHQDLQPAHQAGFLNADHILSLQRTIGNQAVMRMLSVGSSSKTVQRQPDPVKTAPVKADPKAPVLDGGEAARRVELALFDSGGFFASTRQLINQFKDDMKTEMGWYAGDKKESQKKKDKSLLDTGTDFAKTTAQEKAKEFGKKAIETLLTAFGAGAGPAGAAAGAAIGGITKLLTDDYDAVVVEPALKPPHQHYVEALLDITDKRQDGLRDAWTERTTELIQEQGAAGLKAYADQIKAATQQIRNSFYAQMARDYLAYAPDKTVNLETPHSKYTGSKQGNVDFFGYGAGAHFATKFSGGDIYVEIDGKPGDRTDYMKVKRTVVPQLPSTVLAQLNDPKRTQGKHIYDLPYRRVIMELGSSNFPARVDFNLASGGKLEIAKTPSYSRQFMLEIAKAHGNRGNTTTPGGEFSSLEMEGSVLLWGWLVNVPMHELNFSA